MTKISLLPALLQAGVSADDLLPIVDVSAGATKRIAYSELFPALRVTVAGTSTALGTSDTLVLQTAVFTPKTPLVLMSALASLQFASGSTAFDVFCSLRLRLSASPFTVIETVSTVNTFIVAQAGMGAAQQIVALAPVPVTPGVGYYVDLVARKGSAAVTISATNSRIDVASL